MSMQYDETPGDVLADLGRALADERVRGRVSDDAKGALQEAGVDVDKLPGGALDAIGSAQPEELEELGRACATVRAFSKRLGLGTNEFL
jgi:hypothetical protein